MRSAERVLQPPWWLLAELACRSCSSVHALTLEVHCADCGGRACALCVVIVDDERLCAACARARREA